MKSDKLGIGKSVWACVAFWLLTVFGGAIAMIWNAVSMFITGYGYMEGSFGYLVLHIASSAFGAALANAAIKSITKGLADVMCIINMSVAATLFFAINTISWVQGRNDWKSIVGMYVAVIVYVIGIVVISKEHKENIGYILDNIKRVD